MKNITVFSWDFIRLFAKYHHEFVIIEASDSSSAISSMARHRNLLHVLILLFATWISGRSDERFLCKILVSRKFNTSIFILKVKIRRC